MEEFHERDATGERDGVFLCVLGVVLEVQALDQDAVDVAHDIDVGEDSLSHFDVRGSSESRGSSMGLAAKQLVLLPAGRASQRRQEVRCRQR